MPADAHEVALLEPWYGGSHRAFADAWVQRSRNRVEIVSLPPRHWRWRQEAAAWELARRVASSSRPDVLVCSDYVDLPRLIGFLPMEWRDVPTVAYFHENQLTYPGADDERDLTHGFSNVLTAVRADAVVFNSRFHLEDFRAASDAFLARLPRPNPRAELAAALEQAEVVPPLPELERVPLGRGGDGPLRVAFPHRLERDKDPVTFLRAARVVVDRGAALELVLLGGDAAAARPEVRAELDGAAELIVHSGHVASREDYLTRLGACDVVVSTAAHEFFGVAFAEAMAAGCTPLARDRVNYPALLERYEGGPPGAGLAGDVDDLTARLGRLAADPAATRAASARSAARAAVLHLDAAHAATSLDAIVDRIHAPG